MCKCKVVFNNKIRRKLHMDKEYVIRCNSLPDWCYNIPKNNIFIKNIWLDDVITEYNKYKELIPGEIMFNNLGFLYFVMKNKYINCWQNMLNSLSTYPLVYTSNIPTIFCNSIYFLNGKSHFGFIVTDKVISSKFRKKFIDFLIDPKNLSENIKDIIDEYLIFDVNSIISKQHSQQQIICLIAIKIYINSIWKNAKNYGLSNNLTYYIRQQIKEILICGFIDIDNIVNKIIVKSKETININEVHIGMILASLIDAIVFLIMIGSKILNLVCIIKEVNVGCKHLPIQLIIENIERLQNIYGINEQIMSQFTCSVFLLLNYPNNNYLNTCLYKWSEISSNFILYPRVVVIGLGLMIYSPDQMCKYNKCECNSQEYGEKLQEEAKKALTNKLYDTKNFGQYGECDMAISHVWGQRIMMEKKTVEKVLNYSGNIKIWLDLAQLSEFDAIKCNKEYRNLVLIVDKYTLHMTDIIWSYCCLLSGDWSMRGWTQQEGVLPKKLYLLTKCGIQLIREDNEIILIPNTKCVNKNILLQIRQWFYTAVGIPNSTKNSNYANLTRRIWRKKQDIFKVISIMVSKNLNNYEEIIKAKYNWFNNSLLFSQCTTNFPGHNWKPTRVNHGSPLEFNPYDWIIDVDQRGLICKAIVFSCDINLYSPNKYFKNMDQAIITLNPRPTHLLAIFGEDKYKNICFAFIGVNNVLWKDQYNMICHKVWTCHSVVPCPEKIYKQLIYCQCIID